MWPCNVYDSLIETFLESIMLSCVLLWSKRFVAPILFSQYYIFFACHNLETILVVMRVTYYRKNVSHCKRCFKKLNDFSL